MKSRSSELLDRAISAMVAAVEIYDKPGFPYRVESFAILAINGWELLLKAKWLTDHQNRQQSLYVYEKLMNANGVTSKRSRIKKTRSGNPFTHSIDYLAKQLVENNDLDAYAWENIQLMLELRDSSIHFYSKSQAFRSHLQTIGAACVKNFANALQDWFARKLSEFELPLMPLAFTDIPSEMDTVLLNAAEKKFLSFLEEHNRLEGERESTYSTTMNIEFKLVGSRNKDALPTRFTTDPSAPAIRLTEKEITERYPWDYKTLTDKCNKRYQDFKANGRYHEIRKPFYDDQRYCSTRFLDPGNPKSAKKLFFHPGILNELDKHYSRKK